MQKQEDNESKKVANKICHFDTITSDKLCDLCINAAPLRLPNKLATNCAINSLLQIIINIPELFKACVRIPPDDKFNHFKIFLNVYKNRQNEFFQANNQNTKYINNEPLWLNSTVVRRYFSKIFSTFQPEDNEQLDAHEVLALLFDKIDPVDKSTNKVHYLFTKLGTQIFYKDLGLSKKKVSSSRLKLLVTNPHDNNAYTCVAADTPSVLRNIYDWHILIEIPEELRKTYNYQSNYGSSNYGSSNYRSSNNSLSNYGSSNYGASNYRSSNYGLSNNSSSNYRQQYNNSQNYHMSSVLQSPPSRTTSQYFNDMPKFIKPARYGYPAQIQPKLENNEKDIDMNYENNNNIDEEENNENKHFIKQLSNYFDSLANSNDEPSGYINAEDMKLHDYIPTRIIRTFYTPPNFLCISIKRLIYKQVNGKVERSKINVDFPIQFQFSLLHNFNGEVITTDYYLRGFICHLGFSFESGHYVAYFRTQNNQWFYCSDTHVECKTIEQVEKAAAQSYILFYSIQQN